MLVRPNNKTIEALAKLEHDERFSEVMTYLEASLEETAIRLISLDSDIELRQQQGSAKTLKEFIETAKKARSMIKK